MLVVNHRSSSSSCPSPPPNMNFLSAPDNGLLKSTCNVSLMPSSLSNNIVWWESPEQASRCCEPKKAKAMSCTSLSCIHSDGTPTLKSSAELKKEIAALEVEIMRLERYLLSLYRTVLVEQIPTFSSTPKHHLENKKVLSSRTIERQSSNKLAPNVQRNGSSHQDDSYIKTYSSSPRLTSFKDRKFSDTGRRSLADHFIDSHVDEIRSTPDRLSEDIVRCISSIYCKLASPQQTQLGLSASPVSSLSSSSIFSSQNPCDSSSPSCNEQTTVPHQPLGLKEESGPYAAMVEVLKICLDDNSFNYAAAMLQNFRSLVRNLEKVDPRKMKREEKLAFWVNIHNALVMHAHLAYGTRDRVRTNSILKAEYNVGGHCINAYDIQCSILGVRLHHPAPLLQTLFSPGRKFKTGSARHEYALEYPEPLVHFALCSGAYSDPAVRVYSAKSVFRDLKLARDEFIQANAFIQKERKIFLPKILYYFAKDMSLSMPGLLELLNGCLSEVQRQAIRKCMKGTVEKFNINWLPQSSIFRYVIHGELANGKINAR